MDELMKHKRDYRHLETEQMRKLGLFSDEEIQIIRTRREQHEGPKKQQKTVEDFVEYIKHEKKLLDIINERVRTQQVTESASDLSASICKKIQLLYNAALGLFPERLRLWDAYITFCKQYNFYSEVSMTFSRLLHIHVQNPEALMRGIMWEYEGPHNMELVRKYFFTGLQKNPDSTVLYLNYVKIELMEGARVLHTNNTEEIEMALQRARIVYAGSKKRINNIEFFIDMLTLVQQFDYAWVVQIEIIKDMEMLFPREEMLWVTLARRELIGLHRGSGTPGDVEDPRDYDPNEAANKYRPRTKCERARIEIYVQILQVATNELKTKQMWACYIDEMLMLNEDLSTEKTLKRSCMMQAFKGAHDTQFISEEHYLKYLTIAWQLEDEKLFFEVMRQAIIKYTYCSKVWETWMMYHIQKDQEEELLEIFKKGVKKLANSSVPLWRLVIRYYHTKPETPEKLEKMFRQAIYQSPAISMYFKPLYVEWVAGNRNIYFARKLYTELTTNGSPCWELHKTMSKLESMQIRPDIEEWRKCHEKTVRQFGDRMTDVWIDYILFERDYGIPKNVNDIFTRAKGKLLEYLVDNFISEYQIVMSTYAS